MSTSAPQYSSIAKLEKPARNQRVVINKYGGSEVLGIVEEEIPRPEPGEARVRITAAGLSGADLLMRDGVHPRTPRTPFTPGWDPVGFAAIAVMMAAAFVLPGRKRIVPFSVDRLKQFKPVWFREDLAILFGLHARREIRPIIAEQIPLDEIRRAHQLLGKGGVTGRIVLAA